MSTVGIIGGGQLAQLLAISAYQLGLKTLCLVEDENCPAKRVSPVFMGSLEDFAHQVDVITVENENIDIDFLNKLNKIKPVFPSPAIIQVSQDRLLEKNYFKKCGIPTVDFFEVTSAQDLKNYHGILKTRRLGYDGKGQIRLTDKSDINEIWNDFQKPAIVESFCNFETEVSQIIARNAKGNIAFFPLIENKHESGILRTSQFSQLKHLDKLAQDYAKKIAESLDYTGILSVEFFVKNNQLMINEIAPRVHNSGHLTIEGCNVSQFEQHLRAILNVELIQPKIIQKVLMQNIIGTWPKDLSQFQHIYDYGKAPRQNRKLGHVIQIL